MATSLEQTEGATQPPPPLNEEAAAEDLDQAVPEGPQQQQQQQQAEEEDPAVLPAIPAIHVVGVRHVLLWDQVMNLIITGLVLNILLLCWQNWQGFIVRGVIYTPNPTHGNESLPTPLYFEVTNKYASYFWLSDRDQGLGFPWSKCGAWTSSCGGYQVTPCLMKDTLYFRFSHVASDLQWVLSTVPLGAVVVFIQESLSGTFTNFFNTRLSVTLMFFYRIILSTILYLCVFEMDYYVEILRLLREFIWRPYFNAPRSGMCVIHFHGPVEEKSFSIVLVAILTIRLMILLKIVVKMVSTFLFEL
jgi:hypothetical protein